MADAFDMRTFLKSILQGYKQKFHWPRERVVYQSQVGLYHIVFLVLMILLVALMWWMNTSSSRSDVAFPDSQFELHRR